MNYEIVKMHVCDISPGDTIIFHGEFKTVGKSNIKREQFMGTTIFGDCYMGGIKPVEKVVIKRAMPGGSWVSA